ncbi:hypothetical protein IC232_03910 [Microvirga sp. BT688]|uniref:hypothetical protein n=1 Tax=Microvirga sp. TaxID=1873136 RepID=UPI001687C2DE|nr:hypothetical protein [Microvirga sp.]MBD2745837.1 hypothetical protein [Microvirga sp.]
MSAKSFLNHSDAPFRRDITVITIGDRHPIQDPNRPQFGSERDKAASFAFHIEQSLTQDNDLARAAYWNELRAIAAVATRGVLSAEQGRRQVQDRANQALGASDVDLTERQIDGTMNVTLAKRQLTDLMPKSLTVAQTSQVLSRLVNEAIGSAQGHTITDDSDATVVRLRNTQAYRTLTKAVADIYADTTVPFKDDEDELGNIVDVSADRREQMTRQILRSSFAPEGKAPAQQAADPFAGNETFERAVYNRLRLVSRITDAISDEKDRRIFTAFIDNAAMGIVDGTKDRPDWIVRTDMERQKESYEKLAAGSDRGSKPAFGPDLSALANEVLASDLFQSQKQALADLQASGHDKASITTAMSRHASQQMDRTDFVMASRPQALIAEAWVSFAASAGPNVPSRTAIANAAKQIREDFSRPVEIASYKKADDGKIVPVKMTIRPALFGAETSGLKFPTVAVEGSRFYKNAGAVNDYVAQIAVSNKALPPHTRTSLVVTVDDKSKSYKALTDAAEKNGFAVINATVSAKTTRMKIVGENGAKSFNDRKMQITVPNPSNPEEAFDLYSREGQRAARGKLIVLHPDGKSDNQARMIGWQVAQSISNRIAVFGLEQNDFNTCQHVRRGVEGGKQVEVRDNNGASVNLDEAYKVAVMGAPTPQERARREIQSCSAGLIDPATPGLSNEQKTIATVNSLALAQITGIQKLSVVQSQFKTLGEVVEFASRSGNKVVSLTKEEMASLRPVAAALRPGVEKLRNPAALEALLMDASIKVEAAKQNDMRYDLTSDFAKARGLPVVVFGEPSVGNAVAIIGHNNEIGERTKGAIEQVVKEAAEKGAVIHTTAEKGIGEAVIEAAAKHGAKFVAFSPDKDATGISDKAVDALFVAIENGSGSMISAQGFGKNEGPANRTKVLQMATETSKSVVLAAAGEKDVSALIAVEAGQTRPVATLSPNPEEFLNFTANVRLTREMGTISAQTGRGGNTISPVGVGFQGADGVFESNGYNADGGMDPQSSPMVRVASFTRPATVIMKSGEMGAFIENVESGKAKSLTRDDLNGLTAAQIAIKYGVARHPTEYEQKSAKSPEEISVVVADKDRREMETKLSQLAANDKFRVARSQQNGIGM